MQLDRYEAVPANAQKELVAKSGVVRDKQQ
jgi:hypothetical protein